MKIIEARLLISKISLILLIVIGILSSCEPKKGKKNIDRATMIGKIESEISIPEFPARTIDLAQYSDLSPDEEGTDNFHEVIKSAVDSLSSLGGGTIYFSHPEGKWSWTKQIFTYRCKGPIELKSNIRLSFDPNIRLYFQFDPKSYLPGGKGVYRRYEGTSMYSFSPLIYAFNQQNIAIIQEPGNGVPARIDGDGMRWQGWAREVDNQYYQLDSLPSYKAIRKDNHAATPLLERQYINPDKDAFRPELIFFAFCENILIDGIHLVNSPFWIVHPTFSENMIFRNLVFDGPVVNNDGFDPESSRNIIIENNIFNNHDDNLAIKAGRDREGREGLNIEGTPLAGIESRYIEDNILKGPSENIIFRNNVMKGHNGVAMGSEMSGGVHNVFAYNNIAPQDLNNALYLKSSRKRGGTITNIHFFDNELNEISSLLTCIPNYDGDIISPYFPEFSDIYMENITVKKADKGIRIEGWPERTVKNVSLRNVVIQDITDYKLKIENAENILLDDVTLEGELYNTTITEIDSSANPGKYM